MPKITIEYEHPHELTDLFGKLAQFYNPPQAAVCRSNFNIAVDEMQGELVQGYRDRIADLIKQNQELRSQINKVILDDSVIKNNNFCLKDDE